ncbi:arsenite methyltransferase [Candidatus Aerophobetes bacterium]|nr:arsenite methyltransferase [Candidatus Aerophobetes bacterium]
MKKEDIKKIVKERYAKIAEESFSCCLEKTCCGSADLIEKINEKIGYSKKDIKEVPESANLGLGCGNPVALASLKEGEIVIDLGCGAGFDCFLAAKKVGERGKVIGVDMTPQMIERARENARKNGYKNVEFRLGEIEHLPVADSFADVVISNCVINLVPDKKQVFKEAFRVLKPGGRLIVSDIVLLKPLSESFKKSITAYTGCISGAILKSDYLKLLEDAGFSSLKVLEERALPFSCVEDEALVKELAKEIDLSLGEVAKLLSENLLSISLLAEKS